jgi:hypothetical protein
MKPGLTAAEQTVLCGQIILIRHSRMLSSAEFFLEPFRHIQRHQP